MPDDRPIGFTQLHLIVYDQQEKPSVLIDLDVCCDCGQVLWGLDAQTRHVEEHQFVEDERERVERLEVRFKELEDRLRKLEADHGLLAQDITVSGRYHFPGVSYEDVRFPLPQDGVKSAPEETPEGEGMANNPPQGSTDDVPTVGVPTPLVPTVGQKTDDVATVPLGDVFGPIPQFDPREFSVGDTVEAVLKGRLTSYDPDLGMWILRTDGSDHTPWEISLHWAQPFRRPGEVGERTQVSEPISDKLQEATGGAHRWPGNDPVMELPLPQPRGFVDMALKGPRGQQAPQYTPEDAPGPQETTGGSQQASRPDSPLLYELVRISDELSKGLQDLPLMANEEDSQVLAAKNRKVFVKAMDRLRALQLVIADLGIQSFERPKQARLSAEAAYLRKEAERHRWTDSGWRAAQQHLRDHDFGQGHMVLPWDARGGYACKCGSGMNADLVNRLYEDEDEHERVGDRCKCGRSLRNQTFAQHLALVGVAPS